MDKMQELLKQRAEIEEQIEEQKKAGREDALKLVKSLIQEYGFTATQLKGVMKTRGRPKASAAEKKPRKPRTPKTGV